MKSILSLYLIAILSSTAAIGQIKEELAILEEVAIEEDAALAQQSQNPVGDLISLPFQNNLNLDVGPDDRNQNILNIQPVIPVKLSKNFNLINRTIAPVISQPGPGDDRTFGLGDINYTGFISPSTPGKVIWGVGPTIEFPTATDDFIGSDKWSIGPAVVVLTMPGSWVIGALASNFWSVAGDDDAPSVNQFFSQIFANYNFPSGWYLTSAPIILANWEASSGNKWTVPVGGGLGKVSRIGKQPLNVNSQLFYFVERPEMGAKWQWRFQFQLLFPK